MRISVLSPAEEMKYQAQTPLPYLDELKIEPKHAISSVYKAKDT